MKNTYNAETVARCDAFIYHILTHAPEGVNIKGERKGETAHFYIMNAPAPLYDFTGYGSAVHHVKPNGETFCANEAYDKILTDLRATLPIYKAAHGSERVEHVMHIGHPRRSFVSMAKNTPTPKKPKAAPLAAYVIPKAEQGTRNAEIVAAMWRELAAVLNNMQTTDDEPRRELAKLSDEVRAGIVKYNGDNTPRAYNFEGTAITCPPTALAYIFVKFCKTFKYKPVQTVTINVNRVAEVAPVETVAAPAAVVEPEPEKVAEVAPVEVKAVERRRVGLGCMVARLVVALLSLIIAGLRVAVAAIHLAERGRLGKIVAEKIARAAEALRVAVVGCVVAIRSAIRARVEAIRLAVVGRCVACRSAVLRCIGSARLALIFRAVAIRSAVLRCAAAGRAAVVGRYTAICLAIRARVEAVRLAIVGHIVRLSQVVSVAACWLLLSARRVEHLAYRLENL